MIAEDLQDQLDEVECVESMFPDEGEVEMDEFAKRKIETFLVSQNATVETKNLPMLNYMIQLKELSIDGEMPRLSISYPPDYPSHQPPFVCVLSSKLPEHLSHKLNSLLADYGNSLVGQASVLQIYQKSVELLEPLLQPTTGQETNSIESDDEEDERINPELANWSDETKLYFAPSIPVIGRRAIYFHHIIAPNKRRVVVDWAVELELGGYSKIGWPGIVIIEGPEYCAQEYVRRLQHLRWKQMVVRGEQTEEGNANQTINSMRKLHYAFRQLPENGMSELASCCREAGLEDLFLATMKIYRQSDSKPSDTVTSTKNQRHKNKKNKKGN